MSRVARLLDLLQTLRRRRSPVTARSLARELGVSARTIYRDVETLRAQGAAIEGEAGLGYALRPGFLLPPLMFERIEIDALALGLRYVAKQNDDALARAAGDALARIAAVLPAPLAEAMESPALTAAPGFAASGRAAAPWLASLRAAMAQERKVEIVYRDVEGRRTRRVVWPATIGFFNAARVLAAWCETRAAFRHFRLDRIESCTTLDQRPPRRRAALMSAWRKTLAAHAQAADRI